MITGPWSVSAGPFREGESGKRQVRSILAIPLPIRHSLQVLDAAGRPATVVEIDDRLGYHFETDQH